MYEYAYNISITFDLDEYYDVFLRGKQHQQHGFTLKAESRCRHTNWGYNVAQLAVSGRVQIMLHRV